MAENIEMIRPINLPEAQQLSENDVFILDSETGGVRKIPKNKVYTPVDDTLSESGKAADAKVTGEKIDELKGETALIQNPVGNKSVNLYHLVMVLICRWWRVRRQSYRSRAEAARPRPTT